MGDCVNMSISSGTEDSEKILSYFASLSESGTVTVPWGAELGMLTDRFGINWMVNIEHEVPAV